MNHIILRHNLSILIFRGSEGVAFRAGDNSTVVDAWNEHVDTVTASVDIDGNHHSSSLLSPRGGGWVMSYGKGNIPPPPQQALF